MSDPERQTEWLRDAFAARPETDERVAPVAEPEVIWDAVNGKADPQTVARLSAAMAKDPALAEEWRIAARASAMLGKDDAKPRARRTPIGPWVALFAAAAAVVLFLVRRPPVEPVEPATGAYRGDPAAERWGVAATPTRSRTLRWKAIDDARIYRVRLFDARLTPLHESSEQPGTAFEVPSEIAGEVRWQVQAVLHSGETVRSPTFVAELPTAP